VEFVWKLSAVSNRAEGSPTVVEFLVQKRKKFFHRLNSSGRTMALGSSQILTEMRTRDITLGV
jgi:hypothetical protein